MLAPTRRATCTFVRDDGQPLDFIPGQFVQVHFHYADGTATKRSYSLATIHDHAIGPGEAVEIAVSYVAGGAATALFEGLDDGGTVDASGPYGRFCLMPADANQRYLLIGTGTGVTPYRAMLPQLEQLIAQRGIQVVLLFGARTPVELLYGDEFRAFADQASRTLPLRAVLLARTAGRRFAAGARRRAPWLRAAVPAGIRARRGQRHRLPVRQPEHGRCVLRGAEGHGLPVPQIRREKYVSGGLGGAARSDAAGLVQRHPLAALSMTDRRPPAVKCADKPKQAIRRSRPICFPPVRALPSCRPGTVWRSRRRFARPILPASR